MTVADQIKAIASRPGNHLTSNQLRVVVALERAVARLETSPKLRDHLIFKGGFVLHKTIQSPRFTRDLDALAYEIDQTHVASLAQDALSKNLKDDLWFLDIQVRDIPDQGDYGGLRLNCAFHIGPTSPEPKQIKKLSRVHIDIAFGDTLPFKLIKKTNMPTILEDRPESWHAYPLEFIFAEKLQTLFARGSANSSAKDVYDLVEIFPKCDLTTLSTCVLDVFRNRDTALPADLVATFNAINPALLAQSWGSVDTSGSPTDFQHYWTELRALLAGLSKKVSGLSR